MEDKILSLDRYGTMLFQFVSKVCVNLGIKSLSFFIFSLIKSLILLSSSLEYQTDPFFPGGSTRKRLCLIL